MKFENRSSNFCNKLSNSCALCNMIRSVITETKRTEYEGGGVTILQPFFREGMNVRIKRKRVFVVRERNTSALRDHN